MYKAKPQTLRASDVMLRPCLQFECCTNGKNQGRVHCWAKVAQTLIGWAGWNKWTYIGENNTLGPSHTVMHYITSKMPGKEQSKKMNQKMEIKNGNQIMEKAVQLPCLSLKSWEYFLLLCSSKNCLKSTTLSAREERTAGAPYHRKRIDFQAIMTLLTVKALPDFVFQLRNRD